MKKIILVLLVIFCMGCTREGPHYGCEDGALSLVFTHEGSTANFDRSVADDIELYLYDNNGKNVEMRHIPYEEIKGGKPYFLEQRYTGSIYLIAWILSGDRVDGKAPIVFFNEDNYFTARFAMGERPISRSQSYSGSSQELFLGSLMFDSNPLEEKVINVEVEKMLCSIAVTIKDGNSFKKQYPGKLSMTVAGASDSYHVSNGHQSGDRVIIEDNFTYVESEDEYVSNNKVLPASMEAESGLEDNIVITILENGIARLAVDTETKAKKGTRIDVVIRPTQQEAIISVDSWQIRKALIVL